MGDRRDGALRVFCLCLIVFQNCSLILVTSYSRQRHLEPAYLPSVAVFLAEVLKLAASLVLLAAIIRTRGGHDGPTGHVEGRQNRDFDPPSWFHPVVLSLGWFQGQI